MPPHDDYSEAPRVVVLSSQGAIVAAATEAAQAGGRPCVAVATGYEAAAEVLVDPPGDLVIDPDAFMPGDRAMVEIARRAGAKLWRLGAPQGPEDLTGVPPLRIDQLAGAIAPAKAPAARPPAPQARPGDLWTPTGRPVAFLEPQAPESPDESFVTAAAAFLAETDRSGCAKAEDPA